MDRYLVAERDLSAHDTASGRLNGMSASELKSAGEIKGYSAGINEHPMIGRFLERMELDFFPWMPGTLLDRSPLDDGFPRCVTCGIGIVIGSPCASGILATGPTDEARYNDAPATLEILEKTGRIEAVCRRHGVPLPAAAPQFPLGHPGAGGFVGPSPSAGRKSRHQERSLTGDTVSTTPPAPSCRRAFGRPMNSLGVSVMS